MLISIKDFAQAKNVSVQAVYQQIKRHPELHIHIRRKKHIKYLDSYAQYILSGHSKPKTISIEQELSKFDLLQIIDQLNIRIANLEKENTQLYESQKKYDILIDQLYDQKRRN